jgi:hypothetical protein
MLKATQICFQNTFAWHPSPQVAPLARLALHRSALCPPNRQAACQSQLQAQRLHHYWPNQAKFGQPVCELCNEEGIVEDLLVHDDELDLFTN